MKEFKSKYEIKDQYGCWTVVKPVRVEKYKIFVRCTCGTKMFVDFRSLRRGSSKSCGCSRRRFIKYRSIDDNTTDKHFSQSPLYQVYRNMIVRCYDKKSPAAKNYCDRGITVCEEWLQNIQSFYEWCKSNGWEKGLTIDRIDNNGNYSPKNCRWVTRSENNQNKRTCRYITYKEKTMNVTQWEKELGFGKNTLQSRLNTGWQVNEAIETPKIHNRRKHGS